MTIVARHKACRTAQTALASVAATVIVLVGIYTPASAAAAGMILSASYGPSGGGNTIVGTVPLSTATTPPFPVNTTPTVQFQYFAVATTTVTACSATAKPITQIVGTGTTVTAGVLTVDPTTVKRISTSKIAFQVPTGPYPGGSSVNTGGLALLDSQTSSKWNVCVYDSNSTVASNLLAAATYSLALLPTITSISPVSSPAGGGQTITVTGTGFSTLSTTLAGSIGGTALSNIKVAADGNSFTATTGARSADTGLEIIVKAPGGTASSLDPDNNVNTNDAPILFSYSNGIMISPTTAPSNSLVTIDVNGAGFSQMVFETIGSPTSSLAHVYLVDGKYTAAGNRGVAECIVSSVVSDTELVCDLDLTMFQLNPATSAPVGGSLVADGAYVLTVVADGSTGAGADADPSIISSGAAFIVAPY